MKILENMTNAEINLLIENSNECQISTLLESEGLNYIDKLNSPNKERLMLIAKKKFCDSIDGIIEIMKEGKYENL